MPSGPAPQQCLIFVFFISKIYCAFTVSKPGGKNPDDYGNNGHRDARQDKRVERLHFISSFYRINRRLFTDRPSIHRSEPVLPAPAYHPYIASAQGLAEQGIVSKKPLKILNSFIYFTHSTLAIGLSC